MNISILEETLKHIQARSVQQLVNMLDRYLICRPLGHLLRQPMAYKLEWIKATRIALKITNKEGDSHQ
jgi:hypothetical protein